MPKWNPGTQRTSLVTTLLDTDSATFSFSEGGYVIPCTSTTHDGIRCIF